jgi:RecB family exonuclease
MSQWSNSSLSALQDCGERYRRKYKEREHRPSFVRQIRGSVVHRVVQSALARKWKERALPSVTEARDLAATEFDLAWRAGVTLTREDQARGAKVVAGETKDFAVNVAGYHVQAVAPAIEPIAVERRIVVKPADSDLEIVGTIDLIDRQPGGEVIRDTKTSEKSPPPDAAENSQQLTLFGLIRWAETGAIPGRLTLDYLVRTPKAHQQKHIPLHTTRSMEDLSVMVRRLNTAAEAAAKGVFIPANPNAWYCSPNWCEYYTDCPYVRRGDTRPAN